MIYFCELKLKNGFAAAICYLYTQFFVHFHVMVPYMVKVRCHFHKKMFFPFLVGSLKKKYHFFQIYFVQKKFQHSDGSCGVTTDTLAV